MTDNRESQNQADGKGGRRTSGGEKAVLFLVLIIVGGALGYAAFRSSVGRPVELPEGDVLVLSKGEEVDLGTNAVMGKYTIYDFYADWCPPCRVLDVHLRQLASTHDNVAIRKIDIIDWTTPVVAQHGVKGLPYMILYGPDGEMLAAGDDVYLSVESLFDTVLE